MWRGLLRWGRWSCRGTGSCSGRCAGRGILLLRSIDGAGCGFFRSLWRGGPKALRLVRQPSLRDWVWLKTRTALSEEL